MPPQAPPCIANGNGGHAAKSKANAQASLQFGRHPFFGAVDFFRPWSAERGRSKLKTAICTIDGAVHVTRHERVCHHAGRQRPQMAWTW